MNFFPRILCPAVLCAAIFSCLQAEAAPLALHPQNPHYFLLSGKPTILITSGEHYGAVINLDFNYQLYLDTLKSSDLNLTRVFTGVYVEPQGAFNIDRNTLAPATNRFSAPWARSAVPGYANGGNKFDLDRWDPAYFKRLEDFMKQAAKRGVVVELNLFCPFYEDMQWALSPMNSSNNVNGIGVVARTNVYTLDRSGPLLAVQEKLVQKLVKELNGFDNLYFEICNEPYFGGVTMEWQHHIADVIIAAEQKLKKKHLISQNVANGSARITKPHPGVSIYNFHYATPPAAVGLNYSINKVIGDNETGFRGTNDLPYRTEAWDFIIAGGGLYNNLDYSFTVGHEGGDFNYPASQPGGGNPTLRNQLQYLAKFMKELDFVRMRPDNTVIRGGIPLGITARALIEPGQTYVVYLSPTPQARDEYSVRWTGRIAPKFNENYTFHLVASDGVRLQVNHQTIINDWTPHPEKEDRGTITLQAGVKYDIQLDNFQDGGASSIKLLWSSPSQPKEVVPMTSLSTVDGAAKGLAANYHLGTNFGTLRLTRVDPVIDFNWTGASPLKGPSQSGAAASKVGLGLELAGGPYSAEWINPLTGKVEDTEFFTHNGGIRKFNYPPFTEDLVLRVRRAK